MADETSILRVAEADRDQAERALDEHRKVRHLRCETCLSLEAHLDRTERQVTLLTPDETESEALF